jgi:PAS domain S-box-containing protein
MSIPIWLILFLVLVPTAAAVWFAREAYQLQERLRRLSRTAQSRQRHFQDLDTLQKSEADLRRHTEEKLRGYLQLLDTLINTISNPIFYRDAAGVFRGCNQAFAKTVLGLTRDHIIGQTAETLKGRIPDGLSACLQGNGRPGSSFEAAVPCADGRRREFLFSMAPVDSEDPAQAGSVGVMLDLTDRNRAARDRAQKEKFQGVLETAGAVCHELNQPLQVISGYAELLLVEADEGAKHHELAQQILEQVERIADITGKLQKITRYKTVDYGRHARIIDIHQSSGD